jgi:hypothetical protein
MTDLHTTRACNAVTKFAMPAMSPTMTEGGIAQWKFKEGDVFSAGDVLLEVVRVMKVVVLRYMYNFTSCHHRRQTRLQST